MEIDLIAARVRVLADDVSTAGATLRRDDPGPAAFASAVPGRIGDLGRSLHTLWSAALAAREREAAAHGARLAALAAALGTAAGNYRDADDHAGHRHRGVS